MKIAVKLSDGRSIVGVNNTNEEAANKQAKIKGWELVESDPAFLISEMSLWTARASDNKLVHTTTGMTPDEEKQKSITELTLQNLQLTSDVTDLKKVATELTKQNLASTQAQTELQSGITELTKQNLDLTQQLITLKSNTETTE